MNALTIQPPRLAMPAGAGVSAEEWRVLVDAIFPSAKTAAAVTLALQYCRARHLDPFKRPVSIVPMYNKQLRKEVETVWPGINETQITAARCGWAGMDEPKWGPDITSTFQGRVKDDDDSWKNFEHTVTFPEWCSVTVYRMIEGQRCAFSEPVYWLEAYATMPGGDVPNYMWRKRPRGQLHKCSKAASLRAAFPESGNDYTDDEMAGKEIESGGVVIDGSPQKELAPPTRRQKDDGHLRAYASTVRRAKEETPPEPDEIPDLTPPQPWSEDSLQRLRDSVDRAIQLCASATSVSKLDGLKLGGLMADCENAGEHELKELLVREIEHHRERLAEKETRQS